MDEPNMQAFTGTGDPRTNEEVDAHIKAMNLLWEYYGWSLRLATPAQVRTYF